MSRDDQYLRELSDAELQDILHITFVRELAYYWDNGKAVKGRVDLIKDYVHRQSYEMGRAPRGDEGTNWILGHHSDDSDEGKALLAAYALSRFEL